MEGYGYFPNSIPYYGYYSYQSNSAASDSSHGYGFPSDSRYYGYGPSQVHDKWYQSHAPEPPVERINRSQVRNEAAEEDGHLRAALSQILDMLKEVKAEIPKIVNKIDEFNRNWKEQSTSINENIEEICEKDGGEESLTDRVVVDKGSKCDEHHVFEKITKPKFEVEYIAGGEETLMEMAITDDGSLIKENRTSEELLTDQIIVAEIGILSEAVVGGEVIAKEESEIDEHQFGEEAEKREAENSVKGKKTKIVLDYAEQVKDANNDVIKFSRKPKMKMEWNEEYCSLFSDATLLYYSLKLDSRDIVHDILDSSDHPYLGDWSLHTALIQAISESQKLDAIDVPRNVLVAEVPPTEGMVLFHIHGDKSMLHEAQNVSEGIKYILHLEVASYFYLACLEQFLNYMNYSVLNDGEEEDEHSYLSPELIHYTSNVLVQVCSDADYLVSFFIAELDFLKGLVTLLSYEYINWEVQRAAAKCPPRTRPLPEPPPYQWSTRR